MKQYAKKFVLLHLLQSPKNERNLREDKVVCKAIRVFTCAKH